MSNPNGASIQAVVQSTASPVGRIAIPVYGYTTQPAGMPVLGGNALPIKVLTSADLVQNGGQYVVQGDAYAMPVMIDAARPVAGGPAIAVYPVNAWPPVTPPAFSPLDIAGLAYFAESILGAGTLSTTPTVGTGTITQVGANITGVGTLFLSEGRVGDTLTGVGIDGTVATITSNTAMTVTGATGAGAGVAFTWNPTAGVSDRVTAPLDISGNSRVLTQATFAKKPSLVAAAAGINGKRSWLLDSVDDLWVGTPFLSGTSGAVIAVWQLTASIPNALQAILSSQDEVTAVRGISCFAYSNNAIPHPSILQNENDTADDVRGSTTILAGTRYISVHSSDGSAYAIRLNNVAETLVVTGGANNGDWFGDCTALDNVSIGARKRATESARLRGMLSAVLVYDGVTLTAQNMTDLYNYCAARY